MSRKATSPTHAKLGEAPTASVPATPDAGENSASTLVEAPQGRKRDRLDPHDFPDGGGSGGAEAFRANQRGRARGPRTK
jgi:hypothetical protein